MDPSPACSGCAENPAGPIILAISLFFLCARLIGWFVTHRRTRAFLAAGASRRGNEGAADAPSAPLQLPRNPAEIAG